MLADVTWIPRTANEEADALSRGVVEGFGADHRVHVDLPAATWHILDTTLELGREFATESAGRRAEVAPGRARPRRRGRKRPADERLRVRDPW